MSKTPKPRRILRQADGPNDDGLELALLAEFMAHDSVASLARAIANRLGGKARAEDLMSCANLRPGYERRRSFPD